MSRLKFTRATLKPKMNSARVAARLSLNRVLPTLRKRSARTLTLHRLMSASRRRTRGSDQFLAVPPRRKRNQKRMGQPEKQMNWVPTFGDLPSCLGGFIKNNGKGATAKR